MNGQLASLTYSDSGRPKTISFKKGHASHAIAKSAGKAFTRAAARSAAKTIGKAALKLASSAIKVSGWVYGAYEGYKVVMKPEKTAAGTIAPNSAAARRLRATSKASTQARKVQANARTLQKRARALSSRRANAKQWAGLRSALRECQSSYSIFKNLNLNIGNVNVNMGGLNKSMRSLGRSMGSLSRSLRNFRVRINRINLRKFNLDMKTFKRDTKTLNRDMKTFNRDMNKADFNISKFKINIASMVTTPLPTISNCNYDAENGTLTVKGRSLPGATISGYSSLDDKSKADKRGYFTIVLHLNGSNRAMLSATGATTKSKTYFSSGEYTFTINADGTVTQTKTGGIFKPTTVATPFPRVNPVGIGKGVSVTGTTLPHAKVVVTLPNGSRRTGTADAKGIFKIPVGTVSALDNLEIFVTGKNNSTTSYTKSKTENVPHSQTTQKEKEDAFLKGAQDMSPEDLINNFSEGWKARKYNGSDGKPRLSIKDGAGNLRIRVDAPDKIQSKHSTDNYHIHKYDEDGNHLDSSDNIVGRKSASGHIKYDWLKALIKLVIPKSKGF
ncbi:hypothetical protein [Levilactobacillus brevis]|uniref:hypothetical protein n=1 Tax=Levilactobacillus brevis TaxID=1580 RepID=UPI003D186759